MNPAISACWSALAQAKAGSVYTYLSGLLEDGVTGILALFWHREIASMMSSLTTVPHGTIHGGVNSAMRQTMIDKFNCGEYPVLYGQIGAMGVAINLQQGGKYVLFCERSWSPGDNVQAYRRVWRMGQSKHVQVDVCLTDHLIDDMQSRILAKKEAFTQEVMGK
jgi:SNF2 family DNA or RNA helicase